MEAVYLYGRLAKEVTVTYSTDNKAIAKTSVACSRINGDSDFHNIVAFGKTAEALERVKKGNRIALMGELQNNNWTDKDGRKHYDEQVVVTRLEYVESKAEAGQSAPTESADGFMAIPDGVQEELPFK